jgi:hypothetical protein
MLSQNIKIKIKNPLLNKLSPPTNGGSMDPLCVVCAINKRENDSKKMVFLTKMDGFFSMNKPLYMLKSFFFRPKFGEISPPKKKKKH